MTILITGSRGKTALELASMLAPTHPILVASRSPKADSKHPTVRFDWTDPSTFSLPFRHEVAKKSPITAIYLVGPDVSNVSELVLRFVEIARTQHVVRRFVLLSAWDVPKGGAMLGRAHAELERLGKDGEVEWAVVRPHFFMGMTSLIKLMQAG